jgi:hypothetical protein
MDLDREAREGRPGDRLGMPPVEEKPEAVVPFRFGTVLLLAALLAISLYVLATLPRRPSAPHAPAPVAHHYANVREAGRAGALLLGWAPGFLPEGTTDIDELHDPVTREGWLAFTFPPANAARLVDRLMKVPAEKLARIHVRGPGTRWWPAALHGSVADSGWTVYRSPRSGRPVDPVEYVAIDPTLSHACLWRERR